jgi:uncharacterized membrane protein (TIGR01666 family)
MENPLIQKQAEEIKYFFYSQAFADGFRISLAILLPSLAGLYFDSFQIGLTISLGAMCVSLSDTPGPATQRRNGMVLSSLFAFLMAMITGFAKVNIYTLGVEIILAAFFFSMFNVYGSRAASIGNSGILVMIFTMDVSLSPGEVPTHSFLILSGSLFYTSLSLLLTVLRPYRISQRVLGDCLMEIANYLSIKADFYNTSTNLDTNYQRSVAQQIVVHEKQEVVREFLFKTRQIVEETTSEGRRLVFAFVEAVDLFENVTASYYDYDRLRIQFGNSGALQLVSETLKKGAGELNAIGFAIQANTGFKQSFNYEEEVNRLKQKIDIIAPREQPSALILRKILVSVRRFFNDLSSLKQYFQRDITAKEPTLDSSRFVSHQSLDPKIFWNNFSLQSFAFRHSLRVCIACLAGFIVAKLIAYGHHSYWILMTIAFMLKPAFSLTKQRNIQRIIGTFVGGAIGVAILLFIHDKTIHFIIMIIFMIATYSFMRIRYLVTVICTTPYILILFSFLGGEFKQVLEERLLDTGIGCAIAFLAGYLLFPSWEAHQLEKDMRGMVRANANYLDKIIEALSGCKVNMLEYKLSRKDVYLNSANLAAAFQRMLSEPKSKQRSEKEIHQFVVLNHILFSNIANLSSNVIGKDVRPHPQELVVIGRKALHKLNEIRKSLGDQPIQETDLLKKSTAIAKAESPDDILLKEQLNFISNLATELDKIATIIVARY